MFEFENGLPVEVRWSAAPCVGCERWFAILARAKVLAAAEQATAEHVEAVDLSSYAAILQRLRNGRPEVEEFDHALAAANDRAE